MLQQLTVSHSQEVIATITSKGQITIPALVRKHLDVNTHDKIAFIIEPKGEVRIKTPKYPTIASLRGAAGSLPTRMSYRKIKDIAYADRFQTKYSKEK